MSTRVNYTMTPTLSLQIYARPFVSAGALLELQGAGQRPRANGTRTATRRSRTPTILTSTYRSFRTTNVLRWEYRPGSALFVVWQQGAGRGRLAGRFSLRPRSQRSLRCPGRECLSDQGESLAEFLSSAFPILPTWPALRLLSIALAASARSSLQPEWIQSWLGEYAAGRHADVAAKLRSVSDLKAFEADLDKTAAKWLGGTAGTPELRRRALAAFALESASAQLERGSAATKLLEWGCRQIRRHPKPDEFDCLWHLAAFALFAGAVDADGLEAHVVHAQFQFPKEPWLAFERAVASELRTFPRVVAESRVPAATVTKSMEEAVKRYTEAANNEPTRAEAFLRRGRIELALGRADQALESLDRVSPTDDRNVQYLGHLFRGQALERLKRTDDAKQAYEAALTLRPETQSASMALAAMLFRRGERDLADRQVQTFFDRQKRTDDPWWVYLAGRLSPPRRAADRDAIGGQVGPDRRVTDEESGDRHARGGVFDRRSFLRPATATAAAPFRRDDRRRHSQRVGSAG